ncbi:HprK-related kinase A [Noviherbaspirillum cavernae]|uniref:HprK-related kinase A n=1 Tax=Noviherbaspirillum cavernae TaxID=2320862 RepID=A0A418X3N0_9BURK|nr:HprK-related kinase A [Noviherbaspirillum cavernae]RJG07060.1 HprK-related kinase A [Noviherbaspirillum cavernae]
MNVSSLTEPDLKRRLAQHGIAIRTGAFVTHLQTAIPRVAEGIHLLYADFPLIEQGGFADFHVRLARPRNFRRWFKPQVLFLFDGDSTFKPLPLDQAFPMLEWGLNWCVSSHAHSYLMIHAAVIEKDGFAAMLPAPPGSGKSTLCAALVNRGWRLLSDELALVRLRDRKIMPLPRPISLKNASIDLLKRYEPRAILSREVADTMKGTVAHMKPPADSVARAMEAVPLAWVIFPKYQNGAATRLDMLPQSRALMRVADNAFNYSTLGADGFEALAGLLENAQCHDFSYSQLDEAVSAFAALKPATVLT